MSGSSSRFRKPAPVAPAVDPNIAGHPAAVTLDVQYLTPAGLAEALRGRTAPAWDGVRAALSSEADRALLAAVARPRWAETAYVVREALGDAADAFVAWGLTASDADVRAAWKLRDAGVLSNLVGKLRACPGYGDIPRANAWVPNAAQQEAALNLLEARVAYGVIVEKLAEIGPRPTLYTFRAWVADRVPRFRKAGPGRPPNPAFVEALANRGSRSLREVAAEVGCTVGNLRHILHRLRTET